MPELVIPPRASPVISFLLRSWHEWLPVIEHPDVIAPLVVRLGDTIGTPDQETTRAAMADDWLVRVQAPTWLRLAGMGGQADALEALPAVEGTKFEPATLQTVLEARKLSIEERLLVWPIDQTLPWPAANTAAWTAAWDATWSTAWASARNAACYPAWEAAWSGAWIAARVGAVAAVGEAQMPPIADAKWLRLTPEEQSETGGPVWDAALAGAMNALAPTRLLMRHSGIALVHSMIDL